MIPMNANSNPFHYKAMKKSFIYGKALDFDVLIERLKTLQDRFRAINDDPLGPPA